MPWRMLLAFQIRFGCAVWQCVSKEIRWLSRLATRASIALIGRVGDCLIALLEIIGDTAESAPATTDVTAPCTVLLRFNAESLGAKSVTPIGFWLTRGALIGLGLADGWEDGWKEDWVKDWEAGWAERRTAEIAGGWALTATCKLDETKFPFSSIKPSARACALNLRAEISAMIC